MDSRAEIREFLVSRRAKITPQQAGLPVFGRNRRVSGLRREEVALLAGVSSEYYARLERGNLAGVSDTVLETVATALQLDEAEREHLFALAQAARKTRTARPRRSRAQPQIRSSVQRILDALTGAPAYVGNGRLDVLAANSLCLALFSPMFANPARPANFGRFCFLDPAARQLYTDWDAVAHSIASTLRSEAGRDPHNRRLSELIGELSTRSEEFRHMWAAHDVRLHYAGDKRLHHPAVGDLTVTFDRMPLPADPGLDITIYSTEPDTASDDKLRLLASWWATSERAVPENTT